MRITQDAFDELVKENVEDFDMGREEAAEDAVKQFQAQGADLSGLDVSGSALGVDNRARMKQDIEKLMQEEDDETEEQREAILLPLQRLTLACSQPGDVGGANRRSAGPLGVQAVARFATPEAHPDVLIAALAAVRAVCINDDVNRDVFHQGYMQRLVDCLIKLGDDLLVVCPALDCARVLCSKADSNKANFMRCGGGDAVLALLNRHPEAKQALRGACLVLRSVTSGDDLRRDFSCAYDNVKTLVKNGAVGAVIDAARSHSDDAKLMQAALLALKQLIANDDAVKVAVAAGILDFLLSALRDELKKRADGDVVICRSAIAVLRNLSANDQLKSELASSNGGLSLVLEAMRLFGSDASLQEHATATMAQVALRDRYNGSKIVEMDGIALITGAMRNHADCVALQRQGCLAIRNIAARSPECHLAILDAGAEDVLRAAGRHQLAVDEAYAALRDLQCEAEIVTFESDGTQRKGFQAFGESKPKFNPVLEETSNLQGRISSAAASPASLGHRF